MRMLRGRFRDLKLVAKSRTEVRELRSRWMTSRRAVGVSLRISSHTDSPSFTLRTARMTWAPRLAKTLAHSLPIPDVAPADPRNCSGLTLIDAWNRERERMRSPCTSNDDSLWRQVQIGRDILSCGCGAEPTRSYSSSQIRNRGTHAFKFASPQTPKTTSIGKSLTPGFGASEDRDMQQKVKVR